MSSHNEAAKFEHQSEQHTCCNSDRNTPEVCERVSCYLIVILPGV